MIKRKKVERDRGTSLAAEVGRPAIVFDADDVVRLLKTAVEREGSQSAFAKRHGVERSRLNKTLQGRVPVGRPIANALGLSLVYIVK